MIKYVSGDATDPRGDGPKVIAHVCNNIGAWGAGFVMALSARWAQPEADYLKAYGRAKDVNSLGLVQFVAVSADLTVANMIAQDGIGHHNGPPIRYQAVQQCLAKVAAFCAAGGDGRPRASVHMPRIGCGLAGGSWDAIEPLIEAELVRALIDVTVYDFDPR